MKIPSTPAIRQLKRAGVAFDTHLYRYQERGGTAVSARELGVEESSVVKTLVFKDDASKPFIILMPGHLEVSTKQLARHMGVKQVQPCQPAEAQKHSGYQVGGTSPFGTRSSMATYMEACIEELDLLYINGGKRGFLVSMSPPDLVRLLNPTRVEVGISHC